MEIEVYTSLPKEKNPSTTEEERRKVWDLLKKTRDKYVNAAYLSKLVGWESKDNSVKLRKVITELIEIHNAPIVANNKGFKIATSKDELIDYYETLINRAQGLQRRIISVRNCLSKKYRWWK